MSTTAQSNKSLYHPTEWPGFNRASSAEMTAFGILGLINFIACGALLLTHLWCRNTLDVPRKIRRRLRSLKRTNLDQKETDDDDDWFAPELQADRSTLNLLAVSCLSTPPWILLYLDSAVAYSTKPPAYGVCLVQGSFVMGWAVFMAAGAFGVVMKIWPRITRLNSSLMPYVMPLWLEISLLALPWVLLAIFFFSALAMGIKQPQRVLMGQFYCWIFAYKLQRAALAVSSALLLAVLLLEIHMTFFIIRYLAISDNVPTRTASRPPPMSEASDMPPGTFVPPQTQSEMDAERGPSRIKKKARRIGGIRIGVIIRPMGFGVCCLVGLGMTTVTLVIDRTATWGKLVLASIPLGAFFSYASQPEILRAWGLGRLLGDSRSFCRDAGRGSHGIDLDDLSGRQSSSQPYWGSVTTESKGKSSSQDKDDVDPGVSTLAYNAPPLPEVRSSEAERGDEELAIVPTNDVPQASGADLFRKGVREWNMMVDQRDDRGAAAVAAMRKRSV